MRWITKFVSSKFSGYALIALIIAGAGAGYWFWSELKEFGGLQERAEQQEKTIATQALQLADLDAQLQKKQQVNVQLAGQINRIRSTFGVVEQRIRQAEANADQAIKQCMDMHIARGMSVGPSVDDSDG